MTHTKSPSLLFPTSRENLLTSNLSFCYIAPLIVQSQGFKLTTIPQQLKKKHFWKAEAQSHFIAETIYSVWGDIISYRDLLPCSSIFSVDKHTWTELWSFVLLDRFWEKGGKHTPKLLSSQCTPTLHQKETAKFNGNFSGTCGAWNLELLVALRLLLCQWNPVILPFSFKQRTFTHGSYQTIFSNLILQGNG